MFGEPHPIYGELWGFSKGFFKGCLGVVRGSQKCIKDVSGTVIKVYQGVCGPFRGVKIAVNEDECVL